MWGLRCRWRIHEEFNVSSVLVLSLFFPAQYMRIIKQEAPKYRLDPLLVASVVYHESRFKRSICFRGAHGLMQIQLRVKGSRSCKATRSRARSLKLYDPRTNIRRGLKLLSLWRSWWRKHHRDSGYHWLLHYNQGFGRCPRKKPRCKKRERLPIRSGRIGGYADRVLEIYRRLKGKKKKTRKVPLKREPLSALGGPIGLTISRSTRDCLCRQRLSFSV